VRVGRGVGRGYRSLEALTDRCCMERQEGGLGLEKLSAFTRCVSVKIMTFSTYMTPASISSVAYY
jgi:hypothetical protein